MAEGQNNFRVVKKHKSLSADALIKRIRKFFDEIADHRQGKVNISLSDALMSAFAMFSLKDPSLLAFEERRKGRDSNLNSLYGLKDIPSDTQMRAILDEVNPSSIRGAFRENFRALQRSKGLEKMVFMDGHYLLSVDGTGYYSSNKVSAPFCMEKHHRNGEVSYYIQLLGAAIVKPKCREVIPLAPEMIVKQDGTNKNDCERNATRRFLGKFRKEHPHLKVIVTEDALSANGPHLLDLKRYNCRYIIGIKPKGQKFLFDYFDKADKEKRVSGVEIKDRENPKVTHRFVFLNDVPLNEAHQEIRVNVLKYWEIGPKGIKTFSWITDIKITAGNVIKIMRGARARWKIENETFNTLKNQGYNCGHNYGLGEKYLAMVFAMLMMLAFQVDQIQQLSCKLFRAAWEKLGSKRALWEAMRGLYKDFKLESMEMMFQALAFGIELHNPIIIYDSS